MRQRLLGEDLILLRVHPTSGKINHKSYLRTVIGGSLLVDLAMANSLDIPEGSHEHGGPPVTVVDQVSDPLLQQMASLIVHEPASAFNLVRVFSEASDDVLARLIETEDLRATRHRRKHFFHDSWRALSANHWTLGDPSSVEPLRSSIAHVLANGADPDPRVALIIALLDVTDEASRVLNLDGGGSKEASMRAARIGVGVVEESLAGAVTGRALRATQYAAWTPSGGDGGGGGPSF